MGSTASRRAWVVFKEAHPSGPYYCVDCSKVIEGRPLIHHKDHDQSNDEVTNLVPMHRACHARHHQPPGTPPKHGWTPEVRAKIWPPTRSRTISAEAKEAMRRGWANMPDEKREQMRANMRADRARRRAK